MSNPEPTEGRCNSHPTQDGGYCANYPSVDEDGNPVNGRCPMHGGETPTKEENPDVGAPEGSANALKHGARGDPANLYDNLDAEEQQAIDDLFSQYLSVAPFDADDGRAERLHMTAVVAFQEAIARGIIQRDGMLVEQTIGASEDGMPIKQTAPHYLLSVASSLNSDVRMNLKDLGLLDDPESQKADAMGEMSNEDYEVVIPADE